MNALVGFARDAARRYLQSVVFVDDEIFDRHTGMVADPADLPKARKPVFRPEIGVQPTYYGKPEVAEIQQPYHPKELVGSFARDGIICALYEPPEGFSTDSGSELFRLCERPDIIILDWDFSGDRGEKALSLIAALVKQSHDEFPHHARLLSIYTADPSLVAVANQIGDRLRGDGFEVQPEDSQCRLRSGATRLVVFGKNIGRVGTDEEAFTVKEADLATRLIDEFAKMNSGILPSYALSGMAAVRANSKRILDRFHGDMNGAFLLHRALLKESEEAFDQLPALLADELLAVLEDERLNSTSVSAIVNDTVDGLEIKSPKKDWYYVSGRRMPATHFVAGEVVKELLKSGVVDRSRYSQVQQVAQMPSKGFRGIGPDLITDLMAMVDTEDSSANQRLASLFAIRTQYDSVTRHLSYGTIVRHLPTNGGQQPWVYSFCLMPICDTVRLDKTHQSQTGQSISFPFWKLREDVFLHNNSSGRGLALVLPDGSAMSLLAGGKARDMLWVAGFPINMSTGTITACRNGNGCFAFVSDQGLKIEWVGQLKPLHAARIAHDIGQSLSRIGVVEAEWLRLLCDR
ncbi:MAG: response regulator receiver domain [candidate division NC10 bacterium]|nr:response regulator receiver domain [candidate division NC10 bacterium]